jgi:hypothetical protein
MSIGIFYEIKEKRRNFFPRPFFWIDNNEKLIYETQQKINIFKLPLERVNRIGILNIFLRIKNYPFLID